MLYEVEKRCIICGDFYHADAMKGDKCYSCYEDKTKEYEEHFSDDDL